jgi:alpha-galactosidase
LRQKHPNVWFEACSGGGGRVDLGILSYFDHAWTSDNTDPLDRLAIQQGYSLVYHPKTMYCWVTESDFNQVNYSLRYRFYSSFMGSLGIGSDLNKWAEKEFNEAREMIALYKEIRPTIQNGTLYRLTPLNQLENVAVQYLADDKREGVMLAFSQQAHFWQGRRRLRLQNLIPDAVYRLEGDIEPLEMSGQALMDYGISLKWQGMFTGNLIQFRTI